MRLLSLLLLALAAGGVAANSVEKVSPDDLGIKIEHLSTVWNQNLDQTVFTYNASVSGADDLSHWVLQASGACLAVVDPDDEWSEGTDHVTGTSGYIHDFGLEAEQEWRVYTISFAGKVGTGDIMYSAVGGNRWAMDTVPGPSCGAPNGYIELGSVPANESYLCDETVPATPDGAVDTVVAQPCPQSYTLRRTLSIGEVPLVTEVHYYIIVTDEEPPQFAHLNRTVVVECGVDAEPTEPDVEGTTTDNCGEVTISDCEERTNKSCPADWVNVKTWTAIDECGNSNCFTLTVVHQDTLPPVITDVPEDLVLNCTDAVPPADKDTVTVTDVCSECIGEVEFKEVTIDGECGNTHEIHRTWTVADCCGNVAKASQVISVVDNIPPVLTKEDVQVTFECDEDIIIPQVNATDNCQDEDPVVDEPTNTTSGDSCTAIHMYTWTVSDDCWNVATIKHAVTVQDTTDPKFNRSTLPSDVTTSCDDIPPVADVKCYDNCHNVSVSLENNTYETDCENEFVINRTWTCTDECGHSTSYTQLITVTDEKAPVFKNDTIPANASYKCHDEVPNAKPTSAIEFEPELEGCDGEYNVTFKETNSSDDKCDFSITRVWTATDCSNNSASETQVINVKDDVPPVLFPVPEDETVDCADIPPQATVGMYDSCDCDWNGVGPTPDCRDVVEGETEVPGSRECQGSYALNRTWSTTDSCGNTAELAQIINVIDVTPPTFDDEPEDLARECDNVAERPTLTASDNCTDATVTEDPEVRVDGDCNNNYTLVWNYVASDDCGNSVNHTIVQEVRDTTEPTLIDVPEDDTAECDDIPCPADVFAEDNCDGLDLEYSETTEPTDDGCPQSYTIVRTWTATDDCGHSVSDEQRIEVYDRIAPVWNGTIDNYEADCDNVTFPELPSVSDNCGEVNVTEHHFEDNRTCGGNYTIYRNFLAVDECGNGAWLNYTVTVTDGEAPTLSGVPADDTNECTLPAAVTVSASDNCDDEPTVNAPVDVNVSNPCPFNFTTERTYSAVDDCGNEVSETQTIEVYDATAPDFTSVLPDNATYECVAPEAEDLNAADNCGDTYVVPPTTNEVSRECKYKYVEERTWTVTDSCGNSNSYTQRVEVKDDEAPTLIGVPADATAECDDVPCPANVRAEDNCDGITLSYKEERINGSCPHNYTLVRTWNATDECGQSTVESQTIQVFDRTPPQVPPASDISHECDVTPTIIIPAASDIPDNCGGVTRTDHTETETGDCPQAYTVHHAFLYTDECGNGAWYNFTEEVYDTTAPTAVSWSPAPPVNSTYTTDERCELPEPPVPTLNDNCDPAPTYTVANASEPEGDCPYNKSTTHTYTYTDACDNTDTLVVTYTIGHVTPPEFISPLPANRTAECPHDDDAHATLRCRDECGEEFDASYNQVRVNGSCIGQYTLLRTWTCTDVCDLETSHTQEIFVNDTTPPRFDQTPGDLFVDYDVTCAEADFQTVTATDACDDDTPVTPSRKELSRECDYIYTEEHSFATVDDCGNNNSISYEVNYEWECHPTLSGVPADTTIECSDRPENATVTAVDCCGVTLPVNETVTIIEEGPQNCSNSFIIRRCWSAVDDCGKRTEECQDVSVIDTTPPVIDRSTIPGEQTVECGFVPGYPNVTVTDNCAGVELWLSVTEMIMDDCCWRKINRTWTARDECGNEAVPAQQRINVEDNIPPVLIGVPSDKVEECPYELDDPTVEAGEPPLALGWCPSAGVAADSCGVEAGDSLSLENVKLFDGTVGGLNFVAGSHLIRWNDVVGRAFVAGKLSDPRNGDEYELNLEFDGLARGLAGVLELNDTCYGADVNVSTWRFYTVAAGNLTGIAGTSTEGYEKCDFSAVAGEELQQGIGANGRNRKSGLRASLAVAGSTDTVVLRATLTPDGDADCDIGDHLFPKKEILHGSMDDVDRPELECNETIPVNVTVTEEPGACGGEITYTRCWDAEDFHGNKVRDCQTIEVKDTTNPTLSGVPGPIELQCDEPLPCPADVTAEDTCSSVNLTYVQSEPEDVNSSCPFNYKIRRTWTATDACGNPHAETQVITVNDHKKPTIHGVPAENGNFVCNETVTLPTVTANDTCDPDPSLVTGGPTRTNLSDTCPHHFRVDYTYTATDSCGNTRTDNWAYTVTDPFKPVIDPVADLTLNCHDSIPAADPVCRDSCDGEITMDAPVESWTNTSECEFVYSRTWSCKDACGNEAESVTQTIRFKDDEEPTCDEPVDESIDCTEPVPPQGSLTCDDNCDTSLDESTNDFVVDQTCPHNYTQVYQWTYTDCAGNDNSYEKRITVTDSTPPELSGVPENDESYGCRADVPCPPTVTGTDDCGHPTLKYKQEWAESGVCDDRASVTRTWTVTDECGHSVTDSYTITVHDDVPPTCEPLADDTVACDEFVSRSAIQPTCSDDCNTVSYELHESRTDGCQTECDYQIHYDWLVTDECGNPTWVNYTVTVENRYSPEFAGVPADETQECELTAPTKPTASHPCLGALDVSESSSESDRTCPHNFTTTYTWTTTGCCGETITNQTVIRVEDSNAPVVDEPPADENVSCRAIPAAVSLDCTDECDGTFDAVFSEDDPAVGEDECVERTITRTWTCTDSCGLTSSKTQKIYVEANEPPTLHDVPANETQECSEVDLSHSVTATDDCAGDSLEVVTTNTNLTDDGDDCVDSYVIRQHFYAVDHCGNEVEDERYITVEDTTDPEFSVCSCDTADCEYCSYETECDTLPEEPDLPGATDNCDEEVEVTRHHFTESGACTHSYTQYYNWLATDNCGNTNWLNMSVFINDTVDPEFEEFPADEEQDCWDLEALDVPTASDNCANTALGLPHTEYFFVNTTSNKTDGECENYQIENKWTIIDECGNSATQTQTVTVVDNDAPTFDQNISEIVDFTVECHEDPVPQVLTASDRCGSASVGFVREPLADDGDGCNSTRAEVWSWTATDLCGNTAQHNITVTWVDTTFPELEGVPANTTAECDDIPCPATVTATDNCDGVTLEYKETTEDGDCVGESVILRTWTATDCVGNSVSATQEIRVSDSSDPTFNEHVDAGPIDVECGPEDPPINVTANDTCSEATVSFNETVTDRGCAHNYTVFREWTATDDCGNEVTQNQTIEVRDTKPPVSEGCEPMCWRRIKRESFLLFEDVSDPESGFFCIEDECSEVFINVTGCSSNQDEMLLESGAIFEEFDNGFTSHCFWDAADDKLWIFPVLMPLVIEGRTFTVTATGRDDCGHEIPLSRDIFIPLNESSLDHVDYDFDDFVEDCAPIPYNCTDLCPCESENDLCLVDGTVVVDSVNLTYAYDGASDTTTFTWNVFSSGLLPSSARIGVDLDEYEVVAPDASVGHGFDVDSFVGGLRYTNEDGLSTVSVTLVGRVERSSDANTPIQFFEGSKCNAPMKVRGPDGAAVVGAGSTVSGTVAFEKFRDGNGDYASVPVQGAVVELITGDVVSGKTVIRTAFTDAAGAYSFDGLSGDVDTDFKVQLRRDGVLSNFGELPFLKPAKSLTERLVGPGIFATGESVIIDIEDGLESAEFPYGGPVDIVSGVANIVLVFDETQGPIYQRDTEGAFLGNSHSVSYWRYQLDADADRHEGFAGYSAGVLSGFITDALAQTAGCGFTSDSINTGSPAEQRLLTVALNNAAGKGVFEPYDTASSWLFSICKDVVCNGGSAENVDICAAQLLKLTEAGNGQ